MDCEAVLKEIKASLNGDQEHDADFLISKMREYSENRELVCQIAEIALEYLPEEELENMDASLSRNRDAVEQTYEQAFQLAKAGRYIESFELVDEIAQEIMPLDFFIHGEKAEILSFSEPFERDLYIALEKPGVPVQGSPFPCTEIFTLHGYDLMAMERTDEAITSLAMALVWNPVSHDATIMLSEAYKLSGDMDMLYSLTTGHFKYAFKRSQLAELYYNLGFFFARKEEWDDAIACLGLCRKYGAVELAQAALHQIERRTGRLHLEADDEAIARSVKKCGYPGGPDLRILNLARECAMEAYEYGDAVEAEYYLNIAYHLFNRDEDRLNLEAVSSGRFYM